jgi:hypothetical protein
MPTHPDLFTEAMQRRQLTTPLYLFIAGHRPLAFYAGQLLHLLAPLALLGGWEGVNRWAELLSAPPAQAAHDDRHAKRHATETD